MLRLLLQVTLAMNPAREAMTQPSSQPANRLAQATSPYLAQHAHNPVDWYEWGPEALDRARRENRPIFLSIGYAACHWCHVMAHESFENAAIAAVMNERFVNIKVDREERPDLDEIYMQATMILNQGQGGWPMSVWLTPDLKPFYAGTYFPPESRWGRPGFGELCARIGDVWKDKRAAIEEDAQKLTEMISGSLATSQHSGTAFSLDAIDRTVRALAGAFDPRHGGMLSGGTNKFPPSMAMSLMLRAARRARSSASLSEVEARRVVELVEITLDRMSRGGITDHLAGGIARYSTDAEWLVPHFEKMLYDQALVAAVYVEAWQFTSKPEYARAARGICDYVLADLRSPDGGFYSSRDADSEGEEGRFYVWQKSEVIAALGAKDAELFCACYDVSDAGNWQDPHAPGVVKNILNLTQPLDVLARQQGLVATELEARLDAARRKLLEVRARRVPPGLDDKVLCEWNGLMISTLARAGAALDEPRYVEAAAQAADFLLSRQHENGRLFRSWRRGQRTASAFLADYACVIAGLLDLFEATQQRRWLDAAVALNKTVLEKFRDDAGGFFFTAADHERLIARSNDVRDSAVPSGNSVQLMNLLRLATIFDDAELRKLAERTQKVHAAKVLSSPGASEQFLQAVEFSLASPVEIAIIGSPSDPRTTALLREITGTFLPRRVLLLKDPLRDDAVNSPLLTGRGLVEGRPAAYVCRNYACRTPVTTPEELRRQLE
jgi:uncharacterized protein